MTKPKMTFIQAISNKYRPKKLKEVLRNCAVGGERIGKAALHVAFLFCHQRTNGNGDGL
jgi:hypothetical protein